MREDLAGLCLEERMMSEGSGVNDADVTTPENEAAREWTPSSPIPRVSKLRSGEQKVTSGRGGKKFLVSAIFYIA